MKLLVICPRRFEDARGWFSETWSRSRFQAAGLDLDFCQDNHSLSRQVGTLRGMHFQTAPFAQTKLVRCLRGRVFDVVVDLRRGSPTFGQWRGLELSAQNGKQLLIPAGFAHGFQTLEPDCEIAYKVDAPYSAENDSGFAWDDPVVSIAWPQRVNPVLSDKDRTLSPLAALTIDFPYDGQPMGKLEEVEL